MSFACPSAGSARAGYLKSYAAQKMKPLAIPPAAQRDENAIQMLSAWIAENGLHCSMKVGIWQEDGQNEPRAWGILLADVVRHLANGIQQKFGEPSEGTAELIVQSLLREFEEPSSNVVGAFSPGHT